MIFKQAAAIDWADQKSILEVCTPVVGSALPAALVMTAGNDGTGVACTAAFAYTYMDSTTRKHRMCRFCNAAFTTPNVEIYLASYTPPVAPKRTISGITIWGVQAAVSAFTDDSVHTVSRLGATDVPASGCGAAVGPLLESTKA